MSSQPTPATRAARSPVRTRIVLDAVVAAACLYAAWQVGSLPRLAGEFPRAMAVVGAVLALATLSVDLYRVRAGRQVVATDTLDLTHRPGWDDSEESGRARGAVRYALWLVGFPVGVALLSVIPATALFLALFLKVDGRLRWWTAVLAALAGAFLLTVLSELLGLAWPPPVWG